MLEMGRALNSLFRAATRSCVYSRKSRPEHKIDAAIITIMDIGRALASQPARSRYEDREEMQFI